MKQTFYSHGKLLLTGEYLVLDGALALALPTTFGQDLVVENATGHQIIWKSHDSDGTIWFEDIIAFDAIRNKTQVADKAIRNTLINILHEAFLLNPTFIDSATGYQITTNLTFPRIWGLGTSSTLINNIAQWLQVDAYMLLRNSFGGSGYDIACAQNDKAITYQLDHGNAVIKRIDFNPPFVNALYFVYLNRKQSSKDSIATYRAKKESGFQNQITKINQITKAIILAETVTDFTQEIEKHESLIGGVLELPTVGETTFADFNGTVKSLGGWGGDFILAISQDNPTAYFESKGYPTVIPYREMVI